jgi:CMP-N-acetylneuraminic acid synthetase
LSVQTIDRPAVLATNTATSASALIDAVQQIKQHYDYIVELMVTNPLKTVTDIDCCIELLHQTNANAVVAVRRVYDYHPSRVKYIENNTLRDFYPEIPESRRQDLSPPAYIRCGSIYAVQRDFLFKTQARYGDNTVPYIMPDERVVNIDEPIDLELAKLMLEKRDANISIK